MKDYYQASGGNISYTPYNLTVSKPGYKTAYASVWMNESKYITITLEPEPVPVQADITLSPGWNLISMPLLQPHINGTEITCADDLAVATGCTMLSLWNASGQHYTNYIPGFNQPTDPENFAISEDSAVFVWLDGSSTLMFNIAGYAAGPRSVYLLPGWNVVGYACLTAGDAAEWAAQVSCGPYDDICWWDGTTFIHYIFPGTVMQLVPTRGYFVWSDEEVWLSY